MPLDFELKEVVRADMNMMLKDDNKEESAEKEEEQIVDLTLSPDEEDKEKPKKRSATPKNVAKRGRRSKINNFN